MSFQELINIAFDSSVYNRFCMTPFVTDEKGNSTQFISISIQMKQYLKEEKKTFKRQIRKLKIYFTEWLRNNTQRKHNIYLFCAVSEMQNQPAFPRKCY